MRTAPDRLLALFGSAFVLVAVPFLFVVSGLGGSKAFAILNSQDLGQVFGGEVQVTALAANGSTLYLATAYGVGAYSGAHFVVYSNGTFTDEGRISGASEIHALAVAPDGIVYLATSTSSYLYSYPPSGSITYLANLRPDATAKGPASIWSLVLGDNGTLYAGTDPGAYLVSYVPSSPNSTLEFNVSGENKISSLTKGATGLIYGGTSPNGVIFAFNPVDKSVTNLATLNADVTAIAYGSDRKLYVSARNNDHLYQVDGSAVSDLGEPVPGQVRISTLIAGGDGKIYGGTYPDATTFSYDPATGSTVPHGPMIEGESDVPALVWNNGSAYGGTGSVGHLFYIWLRPPTPTPTKTATATSSASPIVRLYLPLVFRAYAPAW